MERKLNIVLDSNIIFDNWWLDSPNFKVLERLIKLDICRLIIPEIVVLETNNNYREALQEIMPTARKFNNMMPLEKRNTYLDIDMLCKDYSKYLGKKIKALLIETPGHNGIDQDIIVARLFEKRKPFKSKVSDVGYRDSLLWEVILRKVVNKHEPTFFITNNVHDFAEENSSNKLHEELLNDVKRGGLTEGCIYLFPNLKDWVSDIGTQYLETAELAEDLKDGECPGFSLLKWFFIERNNFVQQLNKHIANTLAPWQQIREPEVTYIEEPDRLEVTEAYVVDKDDVYLKAEIFAGVNVDIYMYRNDYEYDEELPIRLVNMSWHESLVFATLTSPMPIRFSAILNIKTKNITSFEIEKVDIFGWCKSCGAVIVSDSAEVCYSCKTPL